VESVPNEKVFEFPSAIRLYLLPAAVVCCVMILFEIHAPSLSNLAVAVLVILVGTVQVLYFSRLRYRVAVSDDGIRYMPYGGAPISLQWSEVAGLELQEAVLRAQLVISDEARLRTIILDYQLDKFEDLLSIVVDSATNCDPNPARPKTFHTSYLDQVIVVIVFFVCIALAIHFANLNQIYAAAFCLFAILPVGILATLPHSLTVSTNSIALGYLGWRREIAMASVTGLRFGVQRGNRGSLWTVVWVDTAEAKPLKLTGFTEGSLAVYYSLRDAWRPMKDSGAVRTTFTTAV
jgi:hypothetical protein